MLCDGGRRKKLKEILKIVSLSFVPMVRMRHYSVIDSNYLFSDNCELLNKEKRTISMPNSGKVSNSKKISLQKLFLAYICTQWNNNKVTKVHVWAFLENSFSNFPNEASKKCISRSLEFWENLKIYLEKKKKVDLCSFSNVLKCVTIRSLLWKEQSKSEDLSTCLARRL